MMSLSQISPMLTTFAPNYNVNSFSLSPPLSFNKNNSIFRNLFLVKSPLQCEKKMITQPLAAYTTHLDGGAAAGATTTAPEVLHGDGIGVVKFLQGKNYLVTGATGFLAKVLIEKLLRTVPDVERIFVLIRAKDNEAAADRLKDMIDLELFKSLEISYGKSYKAFMLSKLIPVVGNVRESNLGIESDLANEIMASIDVIVNSSANTTFDERYDYDVAIDTNTLGPCRLLSFAKKCKNLSMFLHFSTAYVNERGGIISERLPQIGKGVTTESAAAEAVEMPIPDEQIIEAEINLALNLKDTLHISSTQKIKELGLERAKRHGWQNTYSLTKAMGELMINSQREKIPVVIIRPSIIESSYREPFPGWIEGNSIRVMDPIVLSYGKGQLSGLPANPRSVIDLIPVDIVVNTALAAMARHGIEAKPGLNVYHAASSVSNPILIGDIFKYSCGHFNSSPFTDTQGNRIRVTDMKDFSSIDDFSPYLSTEIAQRNGLMDSSTTNGKLSRRQKMKSEVQERLVLQMMKIYEPYMYFSSRFDNGNVKTLIKLMSWEEKMQFQCDLEKIDWEDYICNVHLPGVRKHVLKGRVVLG